MPEFTPVRAIRYDVNRIDSLSSVVAPPYDVISAAVVEQLRARSPHNAVRLILNRDDDSHVAASREFQSWLRDGILFTDPEAAYYFYSQTFEVPRRGALTRDGIIGAMRLEDFGSGRVCPHEKTMEGPKADRLRLVRACKANLSPIFGVVSHPGVTFRDRVGITRAPDVEIQDDVGVQHRLWRLIDPAAQSACTGLVCDQPVVIADGHHRYETALQYRDEMRRAHPGAGPGAPFEYVLTYVSNIDEPGLVVLPTHRIAPKVEVADVRAAIGDLSEVFEATTFASGDRDRFLAALARRELQIGCALPDELVVLRLLVDPAQLLSDAAPAIRRLEVVILHEVLLARVPSTAASDIIYTHDDTEALDAVAGGQAGVAFLVRAPTAQEMRSVCLAGETMPQKSTYFYPKLLTGLVFRSLAV